MYRQRLAFAVLLFYFWMMAIMLGSIVLETFMVYPNIFYDVPQSLVTAMEFMKIRGPDDFFPPVGFVSWTSGALALLLCWYVPAVRTWLLVSVLMILLEGVLSITLFWPRNTIMFVEGLAVHTPEALRQTAEEFQLMHWTRLACNLVGSACIFVGVLAFHRHLLLSDKRAEPVLAATHG